MKLNANDMISRATERTSRALYISFGGFLFAYVFESTKGDWKIFGQTFTNERFEVILMYLFLFLIISHIIHWWADYVAYTKWFDRNTPTNSEPNEIFKMEDTRSPSLVLMEKLNNYQEACTNMADNLNNPSELNDRVLKQITEMIRHFEKANTHISTLGERLGKNFSTLNRSAKFVIVGWYGLIPIALGIIALTYLIMDKFCSSVVL